MIGQTPAVIVALLVTTAPASAAWVEYGDNGKANFYYDDQSIQVAGNFATVVEMLNYGFPLRGVLSNRSTKEFNCATPSFRYVSGEFYSEPNLGGQRVSASDGADDQWRSVIEGTQNEVLMRIVCGSGV